MLLSEYAFSGLVVFVTAEKLAMGARSKRSPRTGDGRPDSPAPSFSSRFWPVLRVCTLGDRLWASPLRAELSVCPWHVWFAGAAASVAPWTCTRCHLEHPESSVRLGGNLDDSRCLRTGRSPKGAQSAPAWAPASLVAGSHRNGNRPEMEIPPHYTC